MFGWFAKSAPPNLPRSRDEVGCFGKMPIHGDFIRHNVRLRETVALEGWVQEGASFLTRTRGNVWPEKCFSFRGCQFVLTGGEEERTVAGTLIASRDRSGRPYPFLIFSALDDPVFRQMQAVAPLVYENFFTAAKEICQENWGNEPLSLLTGRVDGLFRRDAVLARRALLERQIESLEGIELGRLLKGCVPEGETPVGLQVFAALFAALGQVARRTANKTPWGIRLPLPDEPNLIPFVIFWMQLVESALQDRTLRSHYFWNAAGDGSPGGLTVFFRPIPPSYLLTVVDPAGPEGNLFDPLREKKTAVPLNPHLQRMLADERASLLDVLYRCGRREVLS